MRPLFFIRSGGERKGKGGLAHVGSPCLLSSDLSGILPADRKTERMGHLRAPSLSFPNGEPLSVQGRDAVGCCRSAAIAQQSDAAAHTTKTMPVVLRMSPVPTMGETIPPKAKQTAPRMADALPAYRRSLSMASVVERVKVSAMVKSSRNRMPSYTQKLHLHHRAASSATESTHIPMQLAMMPSCGRRKRSESGAAAMNASEFTAKTMLNSSAENP